MLGYLMATRGAIEHFAAPPISALLWSSVRDPHLNLALGARTTVASGRFATCQARLSDSNWKSVAPCAQAFVAVVRHEGLVCNRRSRRHHWLLPLVAMLS